MPKQNCFAKENITVKVNKWVISVSAVMLVICAGFICFLSGNQIVLNIAIGLFTGFIVSLMTGIIYYFTERQRILTTVKVTLKDIYMNLSLIHIYTGEMLPRIPHTENLEELNVGSMTSMASLNMDFAQKCNTCLFCPIIKNGKAGNKIKMFSEFSNDLYILKHSFEILEICAKDAETLRLHLCVKKSNNQFVSEDENNALIDKRHVVTVRAAKIHEYQASLIQRLDEIAKAYYGNKSTMWGEIKRQCDHAVNELIKERSRL